MYPVITFIRQTFYKLVLLLGRFFYTVTFGMFPESLFIKSANPGHLKTDVKIVSEDEESVTIAKFNEYGVIKNEPFKLLVTSDLHLEDDPKKRKKTMQMLANNICTNRPDLVVLNGDIVLSKFQPLDVMQFAQFMERTGIFWTIVFGNHEAREEKGYFKFLLMKNVCSYKHCLARLGREELYGYGNYHVNILKNAEELMQVLFMFDSGRDIRDEYRVEHGVPADINGYDFIKNNQIQWYKEKLSILREKYGSFKSMIFMHIPIPEYKEAIEDTPDENGVFNFTDRCKVMYGKAYESVGCSPFNSGLFTVAKEEGSTQAFFSGHDHVNDFCVQYDGIYLIYDQTGGYETYTLEEKTGAPESEWQNGGTIVRIDTDGSFALQQKLYSEFLKETIAKKAEEKAKAKVKTKKR